ncbi:MAG: ABC transporter ATP-binding protein [Deltaproteobacteria bacterium]|nr:MAG: ABC transporter ATP-binding protein [Deltaproteobacteria bacterium]
MDEQGPAIKIMELTKSFGPMTAVDHLTLNIERGELFGLVGPDGAGKTTTMRLLAGIMKPTSGEAFVSGHSILREGERIKEKIGYMSQRFGLYEELSVIENIHFYADLYEVPKRERSARIERLLGFSNLTPFQDRFAGKLSGGMKQKLGLACALIHTPEVLFLDEPTCGVDPVSRRDFWKILYDLLKEKITIFVSTAHLEEAERCTRIGLIHKGRLLTTDEPLQVKRSLGMPMVEIWTEDARSARSAVETLAKMDGGRSVSIYGDRLHVAAERDGVFDAIPQALRSRGIEMKGKREILPSLEDVFISRVKEGKE